ncbi:MAG: hypothetical protein KKF28_06225 [Proteobacteria bacterium]|nr:hypothetical protein [Pseudomonadota bacterium]
MKMRKKQKTEEIPEDDGELSPEWKREIKHRVADAQNPVRYVIFSDIGGKGCWRLWLDVSSDGYGMSIDQATMFKREHVARAVARAYSKGRKNDLLIAKITTKNEKRKVLQYEKPERRTLYSK